MTVQSVILLIGILWNSLSSGGADDLSCLNLTDTFSEYKISDLCLHTRLQNGYTVVDGTHECNSTIYDKTPFGCQKIPSAPDIRYGPPGALDGYVVSASITLTCNTGTEMVTNYLWYRDGQEVPGENSMNLTVSDHHGAGNVAFFQYSCQYIFDGRASLRSEEQRTAPLRTEGTNWNINPLPAVVGIPEDVIDGMLLELMCINYIIDGYTLIWVLNGVPVARTANSNVYKDFQVNSTTAGGTISCRFIFENLQANVYWSDPASIPNLPDSNDLPELSVSLEGKHHNAGDSVEMSCVFNNSAYTERALSRLSILVVWYVNGSALPAYSTMKIEVSPLDQAAHHGMWTCAVQLGRDVPRISSPVFLYVDGAMDTQMSTVPELPIMGGTLFILCAYDYVYDNEVSSVEYTWSFNDTTIYGYDGDVLYIGSVDENAVGVYTCTVSMEKGRNAKQTFTVGNPVSIAEMPTPSLIAVGFDPNEDLAPGSYALQCLFDTRFATFGLDITVFKDGEIFYPEYPGEETSMDSNAYDGTFDFLVYSNVNDHNYSCRVEFGDTFSETSNKLTLSFLVFESMTIRDGLGNQVTSAIHRFNDDMLHLECEASLLPNVTGEVYYSWFVGNVHYEGAGINDKLDGDPAKNYTCEAQVSGISQTVTVTVFGHENQAPTLTIVDKPEDGWLLFNETYELFCDTGHIIDIPGMQIEFSENGNVLATGFGFMYTIPSDVNSKNYTCRAVGVQNTASSNNVIAQFRTIDSVEIQTSEGELAPSVIYADSGSTVNLICGLTLSSGVPAHVTAIYNWYDLDQTSHGNSSEIEVEVTPGSKTTFKCSVKIGDYLAISTNNVKVQCSACFCSFWKKRSERMRVR